MSFSLLAVIQKVVTALLLLLPPYIANGSPPVITKILRKQCLPIDLGKNFIDNKRVFGDGKTYEGFIGGILAGYSISLLVYKFVLYLAPPNVVAFLRKLTPVDIFLLCVLALLGDLLGAFIKRRLGLPRGAPAPLLDQLDFIVFPFLYMYYKVGIQDPMLYVIAVFLTVALHLLTNFIAYKLGIKSEPW